MKPTDFSVHVTHLLTHHLAAQRNLSPNTLFLFHRWRAHLRDIEIDEIQSAPCVPTSHPFIEWLTETVRRWYLDQLFFWNSVDLTRKFEAFRDYYNEFRVHRSLDGTTPAQRAGMSPPAPAELSSYA